MKHWSGQDQRTRQVQAEEVHRTSLSHSEAEHKSDSELESDSEHESESKLESDFELLKSEPGSIFKDDTTDIILAVIGEEDEPQASNKPIAKTRSGRTITKRAGIDFSFF